MNEHTMPNHEFARAEYRQDRPGGSDEWPSRIFTGPTLAEIRAQDEQREREWAEVDTLRGQASERRWEAHLRAVEDDMGRIASEHRRHVAENLPHLCGFPEPGFCIGCLRRPLAQR